MLSAILRRLFFHFVLTSELPKVAFSQVALTGLYKKSQVFSDVNLVDISAALFYQCNSDTKSGGAIYIYDSNCVLSVKSSTFFSCSSALQGGSLIFEGQNTRLSGSCFIACHAVTYDAFRIDSSNTDLVDNELSVAFCSPSDSPQTGPSISYIGFHVTIRGLNISECYSDVKQETGIMESVNDQQTMVTYSTLLKNSGGYVFYSNTRKIDFNYCNFVDNQFGSAILGVKSGKMKCAFCTIKGPDSANNQGPNFNRIDQVAKNLGTAQISLTGCSISYDRYNSSLIEGSYNQFNKVNVVTINLPIFGTEQCDWIMSMVSQEKESSISFPSTIQNIIAVSIIGLFVCATIVMIIYIECHSFSQKKRESPADDYENFPQ